MNANRLKTQIMDAQKIKEELSHMSKQKRIITSEYTKGISVMDEQSPIKKALFDNRETVVQANKRW